MEAFIIKNCLNGEELQNVPNMVERVQAAWFYWLFPRPQMYCNENIVLGPSLLGGGILISPPHNPQFVDLSNSPGPRYGMENVLGLIGSREGCKKSNN